MTDPSGLVDLYLRLSVDRDGKDSLERQEKDLRAWAKREKLKVRTVWADKVSGFKKDVTRENFNSAIDALTAGEVGTLAVWKLDRLSRRGAGQVGTILDRLEEVGGRIYFLRDSLDSSDSNQRTLIILVSEQARAESANTSLRVRDKIAKDAAKGIPKKGTRPFGYEPDGITLRPSEADLIRDAVADVLAGRRSMLRIAKDWTAAGILTDGMKRERRGKDGIKKPALPRWTATTVRSVLLRERNAGLLVHEGVVMPVSLIQSIITPEDHDNLKARIKVGTPLSERAHSLLGGIIRCGECDATMHGTIAYSQRKGGPRNVYRVYKCQNTLYDKSRRHASIQAPIADELFIGFIFRDLFVGELHSPETDDRTAALKAVTAHLASLVESIEHVGDVLLDASLKSVHSQARGELKVLESERTDLEHERDALLAQTADGGALAAFMDEWRNGPVGFKDVAEQEAWHARFWAVWEGVGLEGQRSMIRARYRPTVRVGGRGAGRISPNPIGPTTLGQPLEGAPGLSKTVDHTDPATWNWED